MTRANSQPVTVTVGTVTLHGDLSLPPEARGAVLVVR
jgi:hypothetical protein